MPKIIEIQNFNDPQMAPYAKLTEAQLRSKLEPEKGIFIAESPKVIEVALKMGYKPLSFMMERRHILGCAKQVLDMVDKDTPVYTADDNVLAQYTGFAMTRGVLAVMKRPSPKSVEEICKNASRVAVLENIVDVTNLGAIFRSAAAIGFDAVLLTPSCADPLCRRALRVSMGTVLQVPWAYLPEWPKKGLEMLNSLGFKTAAMALTDNSLPIDAKEPQKEARLAVVLGTEGDGLCLETIANCNYTLKIPMQMGVDSLNVAAASAVAFWQLKKR